VRFTVVVRADGRVGILDTHKATFAHFHDAGPVPMRQRVITAAARLNSGEDTITGYTWEKA